MEFEEIPDGDTWELFCRDFFAAQGYNIEIPPGRGPDGGRDLVLFENLSGRIHSSPFRWLVSCKHQAKSGAAVGVGHEENILERMGQHRANGFIGFYSTLPSAALVERLERLKSNRDLAEYKIFDGALIEGQLIHHGLSKVLVQHLPKYYEKIRPIHPFAGTYLPLNCIECGEDIIAKSVRDPQAANIIFVMKFAHDREAEESRQFEAIHVVCKGECDSNVQERLKLERRFTSWDSFNDFTNPPTYIKRLCSFANRLRENSDEFSEQAFEQYKDIIIAASQLTLRHHSQEEKERFHLLNQVEL